MTQPTNTENPVVSAEKQEPPPETDKEAVVQHAVSKTTHSRAAVPAAAAAAAATIQPLPAVGIIECPHWVDVLMPASGYQLWSGNRRYRQQVELHRPEFRQHNATDQARIALDVVRTVQREGGRFLQAIETPASPTELAQGIVRTTVWTVLPETDVLLQLGEALRDERGTARKLRRQQRRERRRERRRRRKAARALGPLGEPLGVDPTVDVAMDATLTADNHDNNTNNSNNVNDNSNNTNAAAMATNSALQCLYYVPGVVTGTTFIGGRYVPITAATHGSGDHDNVSSTSTSSSSSDQNGGGAVDDDDNNDDDDESLPEAAPSPKRIKTAGVRKAKKGISGATAAAATTGEPSKSAARKETKHSFHYKAKPSRSSKAAMEQGETELPKGVTVRPSGKWQAQTYFAGQSRYVGVYDTSRMAARAYVTVQDFLRKYRDNRSLTKDSPKEELARIFSTARKAADDAVLELKHSDNEMATVAGSKTAVNDAVAAAPPSQTEETMDGDDNHDTDSASV